MFFEGYFKGKTRTCHIWSHNKDPRKQCSQHKTCSGEDFIFILCGEQELLLRLILCCIYSYLFQGFSGKCTGVAFPVHHHYVNRTGECVPLCGADILFDKEDKYFASIWLAVWSILCFISTTFTLITFLLDTSRFLYPEKCIVFLNLSYNILRWGQFLLPPKIIFLLQSLGYLIRLGVGVEGVSCMTVPGGQSLLVREGLTPTAACTVVFILLYFATLSSAIWWSITTTTWAVMVFCSLDQQVG